MIHDPQDKNSEREAHKITQGNNPNDDEEILKNTDEPLNEPTENNVENEKGINIEESGTSETIGIP